MLIKLILGAVIVIAFAYIGYEIEKYYKTRLRVAEDYCAFVSYADRETEFMKTELCKLMRNYDANTTYLNESLKACANTIESVGNAVFECKALSKKAVKLICDFFNELSRCDYDTCRNVIKKAYSNAIGIKEDAVKEKTQKGELVRKLFILTGIGILILAI